MRSGRTRVWEPTWSPKPSLGWDKEGRSGKEFREDSPEEVMLAYTQP